jgi:hypothetical protein
MYVGCPPTPPRDSYNTSLRFRKELSRKSSFRIVFHIAAQQPLKPPVATRSWTISIFICSVLQVVTDVAVVTTKSYLPAWDCIYSLLFYGLHSLLLENKAYFVFADTISKILECHRTQVIIRQLIIPFTRVDQKKYGPWFITLFVVENWLLLDRFVTLRNNWTARHIVSFLHRFFPPTLPLFINVFPYMNFFWGEGAFDT